MTETAVTWGLIVAPIVGLQIVQMALMFAPVQFWQGLEEKHFVLAHYLWGFSFHKAGTFPTREEDHDG